MNVNLAHIPLLVPEDDGKDAVAEANHRIANSLTLLASMVQLQARAATRRTQPVSPADLRHALESVAARIGAIGQLHRTLAHIPLEGATSLLPHLREVAEVLLAALSSPQREASLTIGGVDCMVPARQVQPLVLILCEIFINAMKYAHPTGVKLLLTVDCAAVPGGGLALTISDDGVGLPEGFDPHGGGGLGLRVIRSLAAELNAGLDINSSALGLSFRLSLPSSHGGKLS